MGACQDQQRERVRGSSAIRSPGFSRPKATVALCGPNVRLRSEPEADLVWEERSRLACASRASKAPNPPARRQRSQARFKIAIRRWQDRTFQVVICTTCLLLLLVSLCVKADPDSPPGTGGLLKLSLAEARRLALINNWDLLGAAVGVDAAAAQKIIASEYPNPSLSLSTTQISVDGHHSYEGGENGFWDRNYDTVFAINQLFEIGGKRRNRKASAQAGYGAARATFLDAKRTLELAVAKAYAAAAQAETAVVVLLKRRLGGIPQFASRGLSRRF